MSRIQNQHVDLFFSKENVAITLEVAGMKKHGRWIRIEQLRTAVFKESGITEIKILADFHKSLSEADQRKQNIVTGRILNLDSLKKSPDVNAIIAALQFPG